MLGNYHGHMIGWGFSEVFMMAIFWIVIVAFIIWMVREVRSKDATHTAPPIGRSIEILKERYAKGEITKEQFDAIKSDISN